MYDEDETVRIYEINNNYDLWQVNYILRTLFALHLHTFPLTCLAFAFIWMDLQIINLNLKANDAILQTSCLLC